MKLFRNAIILLVVVAILGGAYALILKKKDVGNTKQSDTKVIKILEVEKDKIAEVTLDSKDGKYVIAKKDKDWVVTSPEGFKADSKRIDDFLTALSSINAEKVVEENASDLAQYGLDKPGVITVKLSDGTTRVLEIGTETPLQDGYYLKEKDSKKVYTVLEYSGKKLADPKSSIRSTTITSIDKYDQITAFALEKGGNLAYSIKKAGDDEWDIVAPFETRAASGTVSQIFSSVSKIEASEFVDDNPSDLDKYGLKAPAYSIEIATDKSKVKLLIGSEKQKGMYVYAKLADSKEVFTISEEALKYADMPVKEIVDSFAYITNLDDVSKIVVDMDGKTVVCGVETNKEDKDKDKFTVDGKDASMKDESDAWVFRRYYQDLIGITHSDIEPDAKPSGKSEITFTYTLKKDPGTMKVEFVPKDNNSYYVLRNGKYTNQVVEKKQFDKLRDSYKKMMEYVDKKK